MFTPEMQGEHYGTLTVSFGRLGCKQTQRVLHISGENAWLWERAAVFTMLKGSKHVSKLC